MSVGRRLALLLLPLGFALGADPRWIRMSSSDFEILSSAGEGDTRRALEYFEQVRNFFEERAGGSKVQKFEPIRVIIFGSENQYRPYRPNEVAAAYYTQIAGRDYIVMGSVRQEVFPIATHEYVHLVVRHDGMTPPPWLNEGIAEVYGSMKAYGGKITVGDLIPGRMQSLIRDRWVPLSEILGADHDSPYYNEKNKAGSLYNEGWALTHMLMLDKAYREKFPSVLSALSNSSGGRNADSPKVLEQIYGKPLSAIEKDVQSYVTGNQFMAAVFDMKLLKVEGKKAAEPASVYDVKLSLLELENSKDRGLSADARRDLEELAKSEPNRPDAHITLGYLLARSNQMEPAQEAFGRALDLGVSNPEVLWDIARMTGGSDPKHSIDALKKLLALQPDRFEVRLMLSEMYMRERQAKEVLALLGSVKSVRPDDASRFFKLVTYAKQETGDKAAARANAKAWRQNAKEATDQATADQFIEFLDRQEAAEKERQSYQAEMDRRRAQGGSVSAAPSTIMQPPGGFDDTVMLATRQGGPAMPVVEGRLVDFNCTGNQPRFVVATDAGRVSILMDDPKNITVTGVSGITIDMNCGPQKNTPVWIEYEVLSNPVAGVRGAARVLHFEPKPASK